MPLDKAIQRAAGLIVRLPAGQFGVTLVVSGQASGVNPVGLGQGATRSDERLDLASIRTMGD